MEVAIPYGDSAMQCHIPDGVTVAVLTPESQMYVHREEGVNLVARAMSNPIDAPPLRTLAKGTDRVVIIASDHTRPVGDTNYGTYFAAPPGYFCQRCRASYHAAADGL